MNDLLTIAVEAHGGLARWSQLKTVKANLSITGALWQVDVPSHASLDPLRSTTALTRRHFSVSSQTISPGCVPNSH